MMPSVCSRTAAKMTATRNLQLQKSYQRGRAAQGSAREGRGCWDTAILTNLGPSQVDRESTHICSCLDCHLSIRF
jgi:hypothetical protein